MTRPILMDPDYYYRHLLRPGDEDSQKEYDQVCLDAAVRELQDAEDKYIVETIKGMTSK